MKIFKEAYEPRDLEAEWSHQLPIGKELVKAVENKDHELAASLLSTSAKQVKRMFTGDTEEAEEIRQKCEEISDNAENLFYDPSELALDIEEFDNLLEEFYDLCDDNDILIPTRED